MDERPCILLVEDDASMATILGYNLRRAGYQVLSENNGAAGLRTALTHAVDLAIVDIMLPALDGLSVLREIARQKPELPVIMVTALNDKQTLLAGFGAGAVDYVTKPFDLDELLARIAAQLRMSRAGQPSDAAGVETPLDELSMDRDSHTLRCEGREVRLRHMEFELLAKLLSDPEHLFSRQELTQAVWHQQYQPSTRSLDVHVRRLRLRLEEVGAPATIEGVRGVGYRIVRV